MESTPFKAFENIESIASISEEYGNEHRLLLDKAYMWLYHQMPKSGAHETDAPQIVMAGPFTFNFILRYCQKFNENTTFVIIDPSIKRIRNMQEYMGGFKFNTVYLAGSSDVIPLRRNYVDIYIDDYSATNYIFTYNRTPYEYITPLIKKHGKALGIFTDYRKRTEKPSERQNQSAGFRPVSNEFQSYKSRPYKRGHEAYGKEAHWRAFRQG